MVLGKTDNLVGRATGFVEDSLDVELNESDGSNVNYFLTKYREITFPELNELTVNWRLSRINAERDAPDERIYRRDNGEFSSRSMVTLGIGAHSTTKFRTALI